ncbi:MAG: hypothetical protein Q9217_000345 [Psora testacea]
MNISGTLNAFRILTRPSLCIPHLTVSTFDRIPIPIHGSGWPDIRAIVLDKDNCFAVPKENNIYKHYNARLCRHNFFSKFRASNDSNFHKEHFQALRKAYPGPRLVIVSNSAGTGEDPDGRDADILERNTRVKVFRHSTKKPGCGIDVLKYFRAMPETGVRRASDIAVVGDRLFTDVMMANLMGAWSIWVKDGIVVRNGIVSNPESFQPQNG